MKIHMLCVIMFYCIISPYARLVQRVTSKPKGVMTSNEDIKDISSPGEEADGPEIIHFPKGKIRTPRHDQISEAKNITKKNVSSQDKSKIVTVKKIPKYKEIDSEEDYHSKQSKPKLLLKQADSIEHEDEDFSLDDYDFDVNHDEFIGRGKPLEPRLEVKETIPILKPKSVRKTKRTPVIATVTHIVQEKSSNDQIKKAADKMKDDDYNDYSSTTITVFAGDLTNGDEDSNDEAESSSEYHVFIRNARSPWNIGTYVDKIGEKTTAFVTKILSFLPLFPQLPEHKRADEPIQ